MQLYIDQGTSQFITDPLFKSPLPELSFKRGDDATINLAFVSGNTSLSAVSGIGLRFGIKQAGDYDGSPIVYTDEYTTAGTNYVLNPSFNTTALNSLLSGDASSVAGMLEIEVTASGIVTSTNTQAVTINNDVIKNGELTPTVLPTPLEWLGDNQIALDSTPYIAYVTFDPATFIDPVPLYDTSGANYSSDGETTPAVAGNWFSLEYSSFFSGWLLIPSYDGTTFTPDVSWLKTGLSAFPPAGTYEAVGPADPEYQFVDIAVTTQNTKDTHRFLASQDDLYVNIGALSGASQNWRKITTTAIATL